MKIGTLCFASCTGCHMALIDLQAGFLGLLKHTDLTFSPPLMDAKHISETDLVLIEGGVRNEEDLHLLKEARSKTKTLIALGTCSTYGGVPGLADAHPVDQLMTTAYGRENVGTDVPAPRPRLLPIDAYVEVDYFIPGCPPPRAIIGSALKAALTGSTPPRVDTPVCSECRRTAGPEPLDDVARTFAKRADPEKCFLTQGMLCLGSVTRGGCGAACTAANVPCTGCRGPTDHILLDERHGTHRDIVHRISHMLSISVAEVEEKLADPAHALYAYSLASQSLRHKDAETVSSLIYRIKKETPV